MSERWPGGIVRSTPVTPTGPLQNGTAPGIWTMEQAAYWIKQGLWPTAGNSLVVEDVFSAYVYSGNNTTQTITNGLDLAGKGGMVWTKDRSSAYNNVIVDSTRSLSQGLITNNTNPNTGISGDVTSFNSNGYSLGNVTGWFNNSGDNYVSWSFRKAARFYDCVTWTGTGSAQNIAHNLGVAPGCILVKRTDTTSDWQVYHRSNTNTQYMVLNSDAAVATGTTRWNSTTPTASVFTVGTDATVNASGGTYVAYLFAHDASSDGIIQCGTYTGTGNINTITLGWEPQWILVKRKSGVAGWMIMDIMRGMPTSTTGASALYPNTTDTEAVWPPCYPTSSGFYIDNSLDTFLNASGSTYVYIAIRRGPMRTPTLGTTVFQPIAYTADNTDNRLVTTSILTDMAMARVRNDTSALSFYVADRLRGNASLGTAGADAENTDADSYMTPTVGYGNAFSAMNGFGVGNDATRKLNYLTNNEIAYAFRRAPVFFDEVCYRGNGTSGRTVAHNLGAVPELTIIKARNSGVDDWFVLQPDTATTYRRNILDGSSAQSIYDYDPATGGYDFTAAPTATQLTLGSYSNTNGSSVNYVAWLFASCPGVSKIGNYTGNGSSQTINCGFTSGARFVLIKRTDSGGNWYVWDSARGIVAGNDPYLYVNGNNAEVSSDDSVDTDNTGFVVNQVAATSVNVSSATYLYLAIS